MSEMRWIWVASVAHLAVGREWAAFGREPIDDRREWVPPAHAPVVNNSLPDWGGFVLCEFSLDRWWDASLIIDPVTKRPADNRYRPLVAICINPSDAGADADDNTSAKCTTYARRENANGLVMVNLDPGISKDPDELCNVRLPYGCFELHWEAVARALSENAVAFVAGWGKPPRGFAAYHERIARVKDIAADIGRALVCFGTNKDGSPKHPLYLPASTPLTEWP